MSKRRVVITGVGTVSPNGIGKENVWKGMSNGVSGVRRNPFPDWLYGHYGYVDAD